MKFNKFVEKVDKYPYFRPHTAPFENTISMKSL